MQDITAVVVLLVVGFGLAMFIWTIHRLANAPNQLPQVPHTRDTTRRAAASADRLERLTNTLRADLRQLDKDGR